MEVDQSVSRPGRPKSAEKREAIGKAAGELFLKEGFDRTSMDAVANRAGVSKQTVYSHFNSKDELFSACIDQKIRQYELALESSPRGLALREGLTALAERFLRLVSDRGVRAMWRLMISEAPAHPHIARMFYEAGPQRTFASIADFLALHVEREELAIDDCIAAAKLFLVLVRGEYHTQLMLQLIEEIPEDVRRAQAEKAVDQFLRIHGASGR